MELDFKIKVIFTQSNGEKAEFEITQMKAAVDLLEEGIKSSLYTKGSLILTITKG